MKPIKKTKNDDTTKFVNAPISHMQTWRTLKPKSGLSLLQSVVKSMTFKKTPLYNKHSLCIKVKCNQGRCRDERSFQSKNMLRRHLQSDEKPQQV